MPFDPNMQPQSESECSTFERVPAGEHRCVITECEDAISPNGYEFVKMRATVIGGPSDGRTLSFTFWIGGKYNETAYKHLTQIAFAAIGRPVVGLSDYINQTAVFKIGYKDGNDFPQYRGCTRDTGGQPVQQQPQSVQQQAQHQVRQPIVDAPF